MIPDCGRKLGTYLRKIKRARQEGERRNKFLLYIDELARSLHKLTGEDEAAIKQQLTEMAVSVTSDADFEKQLDDAEKGKKKAAKGDKPEKGAKRAKADEDEYRVRMEPLSAAAMYFSPTAWNGCGPIMRRSAGIPMTGLLLCELAIRFHADRSPGAVYYLLRIRTCDQGEGRH